MNGNTEWYTHTHTHTIFRIGYTRRPKPLKLASHIQIKKVLGNKTSMKKKFWGVPNKGYN